MVDASMDEDLARAIAESMAVEYAGAEAADVADGDGGSTSLMNEEAQINAAVLASGEDDMERAIMASMADAGGDTGPAPAALHIDTPEVRPAAAPAVPTPAPWDFGGLNAMDEDAQISAAVMASSQDDMEHALMMSMAEAGIGRPQTAGGDRSAAEVAAAAGGDSGDVDLRSALALGGLGGAAAAQPDMNALARQILGGQPGNFGGGGLDPSLLSQLMGSAGAGAGFGLLPQPGSLLGQQPDDRGEPGAGNIRQREEERNQRQLEEAIQRSLQSSGVDGAVGGGAGGGDDELAEAIAASVAGGGGDDADPAAVAAAMGLTVDPPSSSTPFTSGGSSGAGAVGGVDGAPSVEDDEAADLRRAMALSLGQLEAPAAAAAAAAAVVGTAAAAREVGGRQPAGGLSSPRTQQRQQVVQQQRRHERWEQDFAYEEGLRADEARALEQQQAAAAEAAAAEAAAQKAREEETKRRAEVLRLQQRFGAEPEPAPTGGVPGGVAELLFELPTGMRLNRRFLMSASCADAVAYVRLLLLRAITGEDPAAGSPEACLALLTQGYSLGINFGPQLTDTAATSLQEVGVSRREKIIVKAAEPYAAAS